MKSNSVIFILFLCFIFNAEVKAQSHLGVKGGVTIPFVNFSDFTNVPITTNIRTEYFVGNSYGISYRYMQSDKIGIQFDLNYTTKGWGQNTIDFTNTFITRIQYLEMPFYLHWEFIGKKKLRVFIDAGPYVAWALSAEQTINTDIDLEENQLQYSVEKDNRGDFGVHAGGGVSYDFSAVILQLEGAFNSGFANIFPVNNFIRENPAVSTNQATSIQFSILVPLSKK